MSRSHKLLNQMLCSISNATSLDKINVEILCSWNGTNIDETKIKNNSGYNFKIIQRQKYNFATNMNSLASQACGEILLIINDDIVLDKNSIDNAIHKLINNSKVGLVTGQLRYKNGMIQHAGITFDSKHIPYHKFEKLLRSNSDLISQEDQIIPAASGALIFIKKALFLEIGFSEEYEICGEDIELSLDLREKKDYIILFSPRVSGIHFSSTTRKKHNQYGNSLNDLKKMKKRREDFLKKVSKNQISDELNDLTNQVEILKKIELKRKKLKNFLKNFKKKH
ncbi:glycosyltransferase [Prochlorococcus marinus]|nr:glycosyltransferase [Prochlorococcus marinus]